MQLQSPVKRSLSYGALAWTQAGQALPPGPYLRKKSHIQLKKEHVLDRPTASELALPLPPQCPDFPLIFTSSFGWLASSHRGFSFLRCCSAMFKR